MTPSPRFTKKYFIAFLEVEESDVSTPGQLEVAVLDRVAKDQEVPVKLIQKLLDAEWQHHGMRRRTTIHNTIDKILKEDWRSLDEVRAEMEATTANNGN